VIFAVLKCRFLFFRQDFLVLVLEGVVVAIDSTVYISEERDVR
jgi:hypothetical protein